MAPRRRDHAREYAQRVERARQAGAPSLRAMRQMAPHARAERRAAAGQSGGLARQRGAERAIVRERLAAADVVTPLRGGELTSTHLARLLLAAVNRAASADRYLSAVVTVRVEGGGFVDVRLWQGSHRYSAELFRGDIAELGGVKRAFLWHASHAMAAAKYPDTPVAVEHVDLTASD